MEVLAAALRKVSGGTLEAVARWKFWRSRFGRLAVGSRYGRRRRRRRRAARFGEAEKRLVTGHFLEH